MLLLSSLLGAARPPVASREEVASAQGIYKIQKCAGSLQMVGIHGFDQIDMAPGERCLVCLSDYEADEEIRKLSKCGHLFHRECIDQVHSDSPKC